jgi:hypothetical protein
MEPALPLTPVAVVEDTDHLHTDGTTLLHGAHDAERRMFSALLEGRSALRTTGRVGLRRATSRNPARSNMDFAPKNMTSGWLRPSRSTG